MRTALIAIALVAPVLAAAEELDMLPIGNPQLASELASAPVDAYFDSAAGEPIDFDAMVARMADADVVLLGEEHTAMDQKLLHAKIVDALAESGRTVVLAMEFFERGDGDALDRWSAGEIGERDLLEATGWYDRGGYRWEYYRPVMEVAAKRGLRVVGANVPRAIPRAVNRGGLESLSDEQRSLVGPVRTDGSPQHRYLIARYFGDTVAMLPPGWFDNMYAAQCLWDVVMARSILASVDDGTTVVLIVGAGHIAYGLGIPRRLADERAAAGMPALDVVTFCPVTAPAPAQDGQPTGHPMGGGHAMASAPKAQFARSLADVVGVFADDGGVPSYPSLGLKLKAADDGAPLVSIVFPDTAAEAVGFATGDRILDVNGWAPPNLTELRFKLATMEWGQRWGFLVSRDDRQVEIGALLFPSVDISEVAIVPGYEVTAMHALDPTTATTADDRAIPDSAARWSLVSAAGGGRRAEARIDDVLEEVHELDADGRVARSLYRTAREDGAVEVRYERDDSGEVVSAQRIDRTRAVVN